MIRKTRCTIWITFLVVGIALLFSAPAANAGTKVPRGAKVATKAKKVPRTPKGTNIRVLTLKSKGTILSKKLKTCLARAEKLELPAPPRDPRAGCKGKVAVRAQASARASCKKGYLGGSAKSTLSITPRVTVRAFSQAIASGRAWAKARTLIRMRITGKVAAQVNCVKPPKAEKETPPPPPPPTPAPPATPGPNMSCPQGWVMNAQLICVQVTVECKAGEIRDSNGNCVTQTNTAEQDCRAKGGNWDSVKVTCTIIQINGNCSNILVINGDGNIIDNWQEGNCNVVKPPPSCEKDCVPPPPPPPPPPVEKAECVDLTVVGIDKLTVDVVTTVWTHNASLASATYSWGDGKSSPGGLAASHTYAKSGTYQIKVTTVFTTSSGKTIKDDCSASITVKVKDGTDTPKPPPDAPGPNPDPNPEEPYPGGYQCYSETTGAPVSPLSDGRCPPGSYGA